MKKRPIIIFKIYTKFIINVSWLLISTDREMKAQRLKMFLMYLLLFSYAIKYLFLKSSSHLLNCTPVVHTAVHTAVQSRTCSSLCYLRVVSTSNFLPGGCLGFVVESWWCWLILYRIVFLFFISVLSIYIGSLAGSRCQLNATHIQLPFDLVLIVISTGLYLYYNKSQSL